jgi:hypothetical protein
MADCCSYFPEVWRGDDIAPSCCNHDYDVTHTYSLVTPAKNFWYNLGNAGVSVGWRAMIVFGGTVGHIIKYPRLAYKVYNNKKKKGLV